MKTFLVLVAAFTLFGGGVAFGQAAGQHGVFRTSLTLPVQRIVISMGAANDRIETKTLTGNDLINLSLRRPLGAKVDIKHEVLAADVTFEESGAVSPKSTLVIYDPMIGGKDGVKLVIATLSEVKFVTAFVGEMTKGFGVGSATFNATTGDISKNALIAGSVSGGGSSTGEHIFSKKENVTPAASCVFQGTFKFRFTDSQAATIDWDGFILKGAARLSGKPIGNYVER